MGGMDISDWIRGVSLHAIDAIVSIRLRVVFVYRIGFRRNRTQRSGTQ
jgi:hypothetical protein